MAFSPTKTSVSRYLRTADIIHTDIVEVWSLRDEPGVCLSISHRLVYSVRELEEASFGPKF